MFLKFDQVTLRFSGLTALSNVSFGVPEGAIFSLIGPNGAGKTTLLNCLSRFYTPQAGSILFQDQNLFAYKPQQVIDLGISRSFQNIELFKGLTVEENLLIGLHKRLQTSTLATALRFPSMRKKEREARAFVYEIMEQLGIADLACKSVSQLPYGIQKRIDIGRALVSKPKLLLLDEPAAGMNESESMELGDWIAALPERFGVTVMMIEHDMTLVMRLSQRIAVLEFGKLIAVGTPSEVQNNPAVIAAYLGEEMELA
ncbi:ABC transporter ATP-binding protein [Fodinisporobacter ferrooxydans]|uniref:ABC transporter ATP-binding protein n=1 Tax=Fodinisporobacter ferrooxydans TaxID=2901836 RepID=A0ABY4CER5_9BACL|nr:ABC transporter ATP-binding protein [Alicyclobacillaceae bacterium MYW30-H2]